MADYLDIVCPGCQRPLRVRSKYAGLSVTCSHCEQEFLVRASTPAELPVAGPAAAPPVHTAELESARGRIAELEQAMSELRESFDANVAELNTLRAEIGRLATALHEAESRRAAAEQDVRELASEVQRLETKLAEPAAPNNGRDAPPDESLTRELERARSELDELRSTIRSLGISV